MAVEATIAPVMTALSPATGRPMRSASRSTAFSNRSGSPRRRPRIGCRAKSAHASAAATTASAAKGKARRRENENVVERHVERAGEHVEDARGPHVARGLEHPRAEDVQHRHGKAERHVRGEVSGGVARDFRRSSEPARKRGRDRRAERAEQRGEGERRRDALQKRRAGLAEAARPDPLRDDHGKAGRRAAEEAPEKPRRRRHEPDRRGAGLADAPDHPGVDVLHRDRRKLRQDRRHRQKSHELRPGAPGQRPALAQVFEQPLLAVLPPAPFHASLRRQVRFSTMQKRMTKYCTSVPARTNRCHTTCIHLVLFMA